jgi:hypothetical protein
MAKVRLKQTGAVDANFRRESTDGLEFITAARLSRENSVPGSYRFRDESGAVRYGFGRWLFDGSRDTNVTGGWVQALDPNAYVSLLEEGPRGIWAAVSYPTGGTNNSIVVEVREDGEPVRTNPYYEVQGEVNAIGFATIYQSWGVEDPFLIFIGGRFSRVN